MPQLLRTGPAVSIHLQEGLTVSLSGFTDPLRDGFRRPFLTGFVLHTVIIDTAHLQPVSLSSGIIINTADTGHSHRSRIAFGQIRLKGRSNFNSRAVKIEEVRERLGIKKTVIQPRNKEKVIEEKIMKKPSYIVDYENRFKSKLKGNLKNGYLEQKNQDKFILLNQRGFKS